MVLGSPSPTGSILRLLGGLVPALGPEVLEVDDRQRGPLVSHDPGCDLDDQIQPDGLLTVIAEEIPQLCVV